MRHYILYCSLATDRLLITQWEHFQILPSRPQTQDSNRTQYCNRATISLTQQSHTYTTPITSTIKTNIQLNVLHLAFITSLGVTPQTLVLVPHPPAAASYHHI